MIKMEKGKIYLPLQGRIGNQLFQYALARKIQLSIPGESRTIVIDDSDVLRCGWENSLSMYDNLPNVEFIHDSLLQSGGHLSKQYILRKVYRLLTRHKNYAEKYQIEIKFNHFFNKNGMFFCENGYIKPNINKNKPIYLEGYFQSPKYFNDIKADLQYLFRGEQFPKYEEYPGLDLLRTRNSVCISVKIEHNIGSSMYDVCSIDYWKKAIDYITSTVEDPLFFICSDNVNYVLENLIDVSKYEYVVQDKHAAVPVSLSVMSECKHFIIGNTTFGWWAQYLCKNYNKIVVAPSRWMSIEMPIDLYENEWYLISV